MNIPDMLTPEEREMARLLGRPGAGAATPSAQLDARILEMARTGPQAQAQSEQPQIEVQPQYRAATAPASRGRGWGRRRGLVSSFAVAASLVLVVGLAWQLRPLTPQQPAMQHAEMSAPAADVADADMAAAEVAAAPAAPLPVQAAEDAATPAPAEPQAKSVANAKESGAGAAQPSAARKEEVPVIEQFSANNAGQSPRAFSAAPVVAPPAPPAPPAPMMAPAPMAAPVQAEQAATADVAQDQRYRTEATPARAAPPRLTTTGSTPTPHAGAKTVSKAAEARRQRAEAIAADSTPDIEADAMLSRHQWIKRIRERHESGDLEGAKASLRRFAHDYPEARIPRDLRPLLKD
ncbi:MAG: hypothetical protein ACN6RK_08570 [Stenotrophomonas sp.]